MEALFQFPRWTVAFLLVTVAPGFLLVFVALIFVADKIAGREFSELLLG